MGLISWEAYIYVNAALAEIYQGTLDTAEIQKINLEEDDQPDHRGKGKQIADRGLIETRGNRNGQTIEETFINSWGNIRVEKKNIKQMILNIIYINEMLIGLTRHNIIWGLILLNGEWGKRYWHVNRGSYRENIL